MKINQLLTEIKVGKDVIEELEYNEDLEDDMDTTLEEGFKYFRASKRLDKMANKVEKKKAKGASKFATEIRKIANSFASAEKKYRTGATITTAYARDRVNAIKKAFDRIVEASKDLEVMKEMRDGRAIVLVGSALGTMFFAIPPLTKIANISTPTQLPQRKFVPFPFRGDLRTELNALKKSSVQNYRKDEQMIREDEE